MESRIYKVVSTELWEQAVGTGTFTGAPIDHQDGYIHFSTAAQVEQTVALHFQGQKKLLLIELATEELGDLLKWEPSRGGALFPHVYGNFQVTSALRVLPIQDLDDGKHQLPMI